MPRINEEDSGVVVQRTPVKIDTTPTVSTPVVQTTSTPAPKFGPAYSQDVVAAQTKENIDVRTKEYGQFQAENEPKWQMLGGILHYGGQPFTGQKEMQKYVNGILTEVASKDENGNIVWKKAGTTGTTTTTTTPTTTTSATDTTIKTLQDKIAQLESNAAAIAQEKAMQREAAGKIVADRFAQYGLGTLANKIMELARAGYSEATITLELQNTPEYQQRFAANTDRIKKGLSVLTPAEYLSSEDAYRQTLRAYGLTQFDNDAYVRQFIANDVSPQELSSRVSIAVQRVQNADPAVTKTLRDFYGIGTTDMVAYILDPNQTLPKIQQQVAAAEIGTAARLQGLEAGVSVSEELARQGITQAEAQKGYATIADILPTAEKLSQIYGGTMDTYGQSEAEQEVFNTLASAQRKRRALTARETATFSGAAGTGRGSLGSSTTGAF